MDDFYYDISKPGSLTGIKPMLRYSKFTGKQVKEFLSGQPAYTLHRPIRRRFERRKTFSKGIGDLFQLDLADMSNIARDNDNYRYILTVIDVFSKYAFAVPLKTKSAKEVTDAFENNVLSVKTCRLLQGDKGSEFSNSIFQNMLKRHSIHFYTSENEDIKAAVVERFNRTLKERIYRYFTYKNTNRYVDVLPQIVKSYNASWHRSIGMAPDQVTAKNQKRVAEKMFPIKPKTFEWKLKVGDPVRMSLA